ncbi:hypothetical protein [Paraburkholderia phytofirmans]|uniref:hypothetical protein n=1 Tax=Paraburkholderia phytofirmans TaxID=261302 RepID=UPI0011DFF7D3|nr:hypothetical protein [Paraburkholderia phytofirmans]
MAKSWQQSLLSSGPPLENDVRTYLESKGCIADFEYSYLKPDDLTIERQFSYDIDASYIRGRNFVDLMVECKYRYPGTRWVFTPDHYGGPEEFGQNAFMHPFDHFVPHKFPFPGNFPRELAPACSKAVELLPDGPNEKTVVQALNQLAYAIAPKIVSAMDHQINRLLVQDHIFYHVPVIATTAELFRLNDGVRIQQIRDANDLEEVATRQSCLVMSYKPGVELGRYNAKVINSIAALVDQKALKKCLNSFTNDLGHLLSVISTTYCPRAVVFVTVDSRQSGFEQLFAYIDDLFEPPPCLLADLEKQQNELVELLDGLPDVRLRQPKPRSKKTAK